MRTVNSLVRVLGAFVFLGLWALCLGGCVSAKAGQVYTFTDIGILDLGKVTKVQCREVFGPPLISTRTVSQNVPYEQMTYVYAYAAPGLQSTQARTLYMEFKQDELNGYNCVSSFEKDKTHADMNAAARIEVGRSTMKEVEAAMGKPNGKAKKPTLLEGFAAAFKADDAAVEAWIWNELAPITQSGKVKMHYFVVLFNQAGVVVHVSKGGDCYLLAAGGTAMPRRR